MYLRSDDRRPQMSNGLALRIAVVGGLGAGPLRGALLPPLGPAGALRPQVPGRGEQQPHARVPRHRPARRHPRPQRQGAGRQPHQPGAAGQPAEAARRLPARRQAELARLGALAHMSPRQVRRTMHEQLKVAAGAPVTLRRDVGYDLVYYLQENQDRFPGVAGAARLRPPLPGRDAGRARARQRRRGQRRTAERAALPQAAAGRRGRPGRGRVHLRPLPARAARA